MSTTNDFVRNLIKEGKSAKEIRTALGRGAHFALPKIIREIGATHRQRRRTEADNGTRHSGGSARTCWPSDDGRQLAHV